MDYEKMYKDALERAKKIDIDEAYASQGTIAKTIFPELAGNEGERIRRELISQVEKSGHHIADKARWISWLEKQKEPHYTKRNELFDKCVENCDPKVMKEVSDKVDEMLQKEQHPSTKFRPGDWVVYDGPLGHAILQIEDVLDGRYTFVDNDSTLLVEDSDKFLHPITPEEDRFLDINGTPIKVGDAVVWNDEAGKEEDGSMIQFKVVEDNGDGYFNIAYEGEENPERWAYCGELKVLETQPWKPSKEQKPADKQDYSGLNNLERAIHRGFLAAGIENVPVTIIKETAKECLAQMKPAEWDEARIERIAAFMWRNRKGDTDDIYLQEQDAAWLKSLPERFNLQPKEEWSEKDEKMRENLLYLMLENNSQDSWEGTYEWLKSLPLNLKKKNEDVAKLYSNEWSEEDEKQIAQIERMCKDAGCSKMLQEQIHNWFDSLCFKMVKWDTDMMNIRNSIRDILYKEKRCPNAWFTYLEHCGPQTKYAYWKPTEKQMKALQNAVALTACDKELARLYNQLKKL